MALVGGIVMASQMSGMSSEEHKLWQYVAELQPQLRADVTIITQDFRSERWYVLHDKASGRFIRMNNFAYQLLGRLNGEYSLSDILLLSNQSRPEGTPEMTVTDILQLLSQLHEAEVLRGGIPLSAQDILIRYKRSIKFRRFRALSNPLFLKVSLFDPDRLLNLLLPLGRLIISPVGLTLWLFTLLMAAVVAGINYQALIADSSAISLNSSSILVLCVIYPAIKLLHELGHGLAIKVFGGEVHDSGIYFLLFIPLPYVDGSASWAFRDKYKRALVGAAGIAAELFLASCALILWSLVEPGVIRDIALYSFVIASISTLLFNANPLLRFDGYYVLEDLTEIPNLSSRSKQYYFYLMQRYLLGLNTAKSPITAFGERGWFIGYGLAAPIYRLTILFSIAIYLASEFLVIGVVLALWAIFMQIVRPIYHAINFLFNSERMADRRSRGAAVLILLLAVVTTTLLVPISLTTQAQGVVWLGDSSRVVAKTSGFISPNQRPQEGAVAKNDIIIQLNNDELLARQKELQSQLRELRIKQVVMLAESRIQERMVSDEIRAVAAELELLNSRIAQLTVHARSTGKLVLNNTEIRKGGYVNQGDLLAYIIQQQQLVIRAVIPQEQVGLLGRGAIAAKVMFSHLPGQLIDAKIIRQVPAASRTLPSAALGLSGGGDIRQDLTDSSGLTAAEDFFVIDLVLPEVVDNDLIMSRVHVRLDHGYEPVGMQWLRSLQQLLLRQLNS